MSTPVAHASARAIGTVDSVAPDDIRVLLEVDAPRSMALNTGVPTPFPRINGYVLIPNEAGAVVGLVAWIGVERSPYPKRQGFQDSGIIDLPFPLRRMAVCPVGTLKANPAGGAPAAAWEMQRGVEAYPSVGDTVILPTRGQVQAIVTGTGSNGRLQLGTCPAAYGAAVTVDPDKLFGRHLAVLGNTGSGKSCTVASVIRAAIESADRAKMEGVTTPNARFIVLDPNGEYASCFQGLGCGCRVFQVPPLHTAGASGFSLPAWMWNSAEWAAVAQAAPKTQRPILQTALRDLRSGSRANKDLAARVYGRCRAAQVFFSQYDGKGATGWPANENCGNAMQALLEDMEEYGKSLGSDPLATTVKSSAGSLQATLSSKSKGAGKFRDFADKDIQAVLGAVAQTLALAPPEDCRPRVSEDSPLPFGVSSLAEYIECLAIHEAPTTGQFISTLVMRIRTLLADTRMRAVTCPEQQPTLEGWLESHIGADGAANGQVAVLDLSLVPPEILHLVIAVAGRLVLEALQRYRTLERTNLPTVLVLEEAHTFVAKRLPHGDEIPSPADMCRQTFERVAREGRKFGLGLVLSSQRPSEISETVLSQCNSFMLHRITNDKDQELVSRLVPDNARGLLRELPSLPTRYAILLGVATRLPVLVEVPELPDEHRPHSDDPKFWDVWTGAETRPIDWSHLAADWEGAGASNGPTPGPAASTQDGDDCGVPELPL